MLTFHPKCINNDIIFGKSMKAFGYTSSGHLLPCCWCDKAAYFDPGFKTLLTEELKVENVNSISEIFTSSAWIAFDNILHGDGKGAPKTCKKYCGKGKEYIIHKAKVNIIDNDK